MLWKRHVSFISHITHDSRRVLVCRLTGFVASFLGDFRTRQTRGSQTRSSQKTLHRQMRRQERRRRQERTGIQSDQGLECGGRTKAGSIGLHEEQLIPTFRLPHQLEINQPSPPRKNCSPGRLFSIIYRAYLTWFYLILTRTNTN